MDYAVPQTAAGALREFAKDLRAKAKQHRERANLDVAIADKLESESYYAEREADRYDKYQITGND